VVYGDVVVEVTIADKELQESGARIDRPASDSGGPTLCLTSATLTIEKTPAAAAF